MPFPVCTSCGKSTRSHRRTRYCAPCSTAVDAFTARFGHHELTDEQFAFEEGYHAGRTQGVSNNWHQHDALRIAYDAGYDKGVADFVA